MRLSLLNHIRIFIKKMTPPSYFEKNMAVLIQKSEEAMQELSRENFNSETLKTLCLPEFRQQHPNCLMAVSTKKTNSPVEVCYTRTQKDNIVTIDIFTNGEDQILLGKRQYILKTDDKGNMVMQSLSMSSNEETCKKAGLKGIGMLERILQIKEAIANGINSIPCKSYARSVLFHLKMGFLPVPSLTEIKSLSDLNTIMEKIIKDSSWDISSKNYTPIIVLKDGKYYLDENSMQCIANLRQILQNYKEGRGDGVRPFIRGRGVNLVLEGENFNIWKRLLRES